MECWSVWLLWGSYKTIHKRNYTTILSNKNRGDNLEIFSCNVSKGEKPTEIVLQKNSSVSAVEIVSPRTTTPIFKTIGWKDENGPFSAPLPRQMNERNPSNKWWRSKSADSHQVFGAQSKQKEIDIIIRQKAIDIMVRKKEVDIIVRKKEIDIIVRKNEKKIVTRSWQGHKNVRFRDCDRKGTSASTLSHGVVTFWNFSNDKSTSIVRIPIDILTKFSSLFSPFSYFSFYRLLFVLFWQTVHFYWHFALVFLKFCS